MGREAARASGARRPMGRPWGHGDTTLLRLRQMASIECRTPSPEQILGNGVARPLPAREGVTSVKFTNLKHSLKIVFKIFLPLSSQKSNLPSDFAVPAPKADNHHFYPLCKFRRVPVDKPPRVLRSHSVITADSPSLFLFLSYSFSSFFSSSFFLSSSFFSILPPPSSFFLLLLPGWPHARCGGTAQLKLV